MLVRCVHPAPPSKGVFEETGRSYMALVKGDVETDLSFKVGGILDLIGDAEGQPWREGVPVASNQVLGQLAQADFTNALRSATAKAELSAKLHARAVTLAAQQVISSSELDGIVAGKQDAEALQAQARQNLHDAVLRAPYAGTILARLAEPGETVPAGRTVLRLGDLRQMSLELGVPDTVISKIATNALMPVTISALEGQWQSFTGRVSEVGVAAKERARLFKVVLKVPNRDGRIKSGMTAVVHFDADANRLTNAVLVPLNALVTRSRDTHNPPKLAVFVATREGSTYRAREREVETDDIVKSSILVTAGLSASDLVVVAGASDLYEGVPVRVSEESP